MRRAIAAQSASMVWMRIREGAVCNPQPSLRSRARAACASRRVSWACGLDGSAEALACSKARKTRSRISAAALMVNVIATIDSGSSTQASRAR